jgi:uncharacterized membrane protein (DUF106 family)
MLFLMIGLAAVIFILIYNRQVGEIMHHVMYPLLGFGGKYVVPTLMLTGMLMIGLSTIIRTIMTDMVKQTRNQKEMSAFNAELRQARIENNLYKIKKLTEQQKEMMSKSMESSMNMMKTLPITMVIIMPLFAWVNYFLSNFAQSIQIAVPWAEAVIITESMLLPIWIFVYMLITMPFAQILGRAIRWFKFKKRLEELDAGTAS